MSYTELVTFRDGENDYQGPEYRNASGGMSRIFDVLHKRMLVPKNPYEIWYDRTQDIIDACLKAGRPDYLRAVVLFCCDGALVKKKNFSRLADDLERFDQECPVNPDYANHLPKWAADLRQLDAEFVGLYPTSVGENLWNVPVDDDRGEIPYNVNTMDKHWFLYDAVEAKS